MAAIDKTYLDTWEDYTQLRDWCIRQGTVTDDFGNRFKPLDFLFGWSEDEFRRAEKEGKDLPVWNTPVYFDVWLIRNCPLEFIQDSLKEQYSGGWSKCAFTDHNHPDMYQQILDRTSIYDTYQRNGLGKTARMSIQYRLKDKFKDSSMVWWITTTRNNLGWWYSRNLDEWKPEEELRNRSGDNSVSNYCILRGYLPKKKLLRKIRKWNLPEGFQLSVQGEWNRYAMQDFTVTVKKHSKHTSTKPKQK